jgi:hypothetical protein
MVSPTHPVGGQMVGLEYGPFGSSWSGAYLPDGVLASLPLALLALAHSVAPVLFCCSDGQLSLVLGVICFG